MRRAAVALSAVATLLLLGAARADTPPNAWDVAKDPKARERYQLHVTVRESIIVNSGTEQLRAAVLERARGMLEDGGAETSPDVRLRFDLGEIYEALSDHRRAVAVLTPAIESAPDHPAAVDAILALAYAHAKLDHPREERDAYLRYLARVTGERSRVTALLNLAEAEMRIGNMPEAVAGYHDAVQAAASLPNTMSTSKTAVLAVWGLAVALDRSGDPAGAATQAKLATQLDHENRIIGDRRDVFFVPEYERFWYFALGAVEHAKQARDAREATRLWAQAESTWSSYVSNAEHSDSKDRWLSLARAHRDHARAEKLAANKRAAKAPPSAPDLEGSPIWLP